MSEVAPGTVNTIRKLGAHLRWAIEKEGVDVESAAVVILVKDEVERSKMISAFLRNFDPETMAASAEHPGKIIVHGVAVIVSVKKGEQKCSP